MSEPYLRQRFLDELFGESAPAPVSLETVIESIALVPVGFESQKLALMQYLDRRGLPLEHWMVVMLRRLSR